MDLRSENKLDDIKKIATDALRDVSYLHQFLFGTEYKISYYGEKVSTEEVHDWLNQLTRIERQLNDLLEVANE